MNVQDASIEYFKKVQIFTNFLWLMLIIIFIVNLKTEKRVNSS